MNINIEEVNTIARTFLELKEKASGGDKKAQREYQSYQNYCAEKLAPLVNNKTRKYKKFSNYPDLQQDGFEALMCSLETYNPKKGGFVWWANKYIGTRIYRAANAHSTIRIPIKKAKKIPPYKTNTMPLMVDSKNGPLENVEGAQSSAVIKEAIAELPEKQRKIILLRYEFHNGNSSISKISSELKISRPACVKLLKEAENSLQIKLQEHFG